MVEDDQISQAFYETVLALSNLPCHPYPLHSYQKSLFHYLLKHRSEGN